MSLTAFKRPISATVLIVLCLLAHAQDTTNAGQMKRLAEKHLTWRTCYVRLLKGAVIKGKIERSNDYSIVAPSFTNSKLIIARSNDTEQKISLNDIRELYLPTEDTEYRKYVAVAEDTTTGNRRLMRVIVEGPCKLLYCGTPAQGGFHPGGQVETNGASNGSEMYYFYYHNQLVKARGLLFVKRCKQLFAECPTLVKDIEDGKYTDDDIAQITAIFNKCLADNTLK